MVKSVAQASLSSLSSVLSKQSSRSSLASNISITSTGSQGPGFETSGVKKGLFKKHGKYHIAIGKKHKKNKISKHDFYCKTPEFRMWLIEEKSLCLDEMPNEKAKELFKKFVKKWNGKKLPQKFYVGTDPMWSVASPTSYSKVAVPSDDETLVEDPNCPTPCKSPTPSTFSTFGKKSGLQLLQRIRDAKNNKQCQQSTPKGAPENIYESPVKKPKHAFATTTKFIPLAQLFQNEENIPMNGQSGSLMCTPVASPKLPCNDVNPYAEPFAMSPPLPSPPPPEELIIPGPTFTAPPPPSTPEITSAKCQTDPPGYPEPPLYATVQKDRPECRPLTRSRSRESMRPKSANLDSSFAKMPPPPPPARCGSLHLSDANFSLSAHRPLKRTTSRESVCSISSVVSEPAYNTASLARSWSRKGPAPPPPLRTQSIRSINSESVGYVVCGPPLTSLSLSQSTNGVLTRSRSKESLSSLASDLSMSLPIAACHASQYGSQRSICSSASWSSQRSQNLPDAGSPARLPVEGRPRQGISPAPPSYATTQEIRRFASIRKKRSSVHLVKSLEDVSSKTLTVMRSNSKKLTSKEDLKKYRKGL